ncbi:T9SS type A sorting domain-containing protein [Kordia sp. YSTF-M3]|uniref:T9SS type A sorting domain-containing protein n=1 Tax=Kordia aestuariivivens TaxID=2759037 RepID=A0ABR7Q9A9_9FLAO|nr:FG-GAP-like repeat-containing protein [Kordia aestuariivivens]MBC8754909.1 T9SS type A sorting domain-containing protein [Kordia aestuariivivens]
MKKTLFIIFLLLCAFTIKAQVINEIHVIPSSTIDALDVELRYSLLSPDDPAIFTINNDLVVSHIENLMTYRLAELENDNLDGGNPNVYYARRVQSHILFYYYFENIGDEDKKDDHLEFFKDYFELLLGEQCYAGSVIPNPCNLSHGGFGSNTTSTDIVNALTTGIALEAYLDARKFLKTVCYNNPNEPIMPISETEFEDRILQAKNELLAYPEYNNQYFNLTATAFMALSKHIDAYNDQASKDFLVNKGSELLNVGHPLRSDVNTSTQWHYAQDWSSTYAWNEGFQVDGSWKSFGRDRSYTETALPNVNPRVYDAYERWHDSELDYHGIMIEGIAQLYRRLSDPTLKANARKKVIASINHLIDYNGTINGLENTTFEPFFVDLPADSYYGELSQTRLTTDFKVAKYHRESSDYDPGDLGTSAVIGAQILRSLIVSKNNLKTTLLPTDIDRLNKMIDGMAYGIIQDPASLAVQQFYDLALYLNRDAINGNFPGTQYTNDKLIVSFENKLISAFHQDDVPAGDKLVRVDNFYIHEQESYQMVSGDFSGDGDDEAIISFEYGNIYRYTENTDGRLTTSERIYDDGVLTLTLESGDFNDNGKDELIVALDNGEIRRYEEDLSGDLTLIETFYSNTSRTIQAMKALDFNNNGKDELIVAFDDGSIRRYRVNTPGDLAPILHPINYIPNQFVTALESGDFDGDENEELILLYDHGVIKRYKEENIGGTLSVTNETVYASASNALNIKAGDFDDDMKDELIIALDDDTIWRYKENVSGVLTANINGPFYNHNQSVKALAVGDFNNDDTEELVISFQYGLIYRYYENSSGNLQIKEGIYNCDNITNTMVVLEKNSPVSRANAQQDLLFEEAIHIDMKAFPNPVSNMLKVSGLNSEASFSIYSLEGKLITKGIVQKDGEIDFSKLSKGFYILKIANNSIFKIIKK